MSRTRSHSAVLGVRTFCGALRWRAAVSIADGRASAEVEQLAEERWECHWPGAIHHALQRREAATMLAGRDRVDVNAGLLQDIKQPSRGRVSAVQDLLSQESSDFHACSTTASRQKSTIPTSH